MTASLESLVAASSPAKTVQLAKETMPFLADHGVQGATIVPGALYLALALRDYNATRWLPVVRFAQIEFRRPVILGRQPVAITIESKPLTEHCMRYAFRELGTSDESDSPDVTFEIRGGFEQDIAPPPQMSPREEFQRTAGAPMEREEFYRRLNEHGNQYGPCFQGLQRLWRKDDEVLARLALTRGLEEFLLDPLAVDAAVQSLAAVALDHAQTLVLRSIEEITFHGAPHSVESWVHAKARPAGVTANMLIGDIEVRDDTGDCWLQLRGVTWVRQDLPHATSPIREFAVAATFTAEPIAEVFRFWSDTTSLQTRTTFAPYGQVFQQLLDPRSLLRRNRTGCNVLLVNPADWVAPAASLSLPKFPDAERHFSGLDRVTLPNGLEIAHLNRYETDYVYREIFTDRCYLRHGIRLPANGTVIDIGANIGLFTLFVRSEAPDATVFAFEPSPAAFRALQANCAGYGPNLTAINAGVGERRGEATLTCYEKSSVFSSFHANAVEDGQAIRAVAENVAREATGGVENDPALIDELLTDRLQARTVTCPIVSVSDIIRDHQLKRIDLLKIDAEKCEEEILRGIDEAYWPLIAQVVIEVHDRTRQLLDRVVGQLTKHGFHCAVVEEALLTGSGLFNVYAARESSKLVATEIADASAPLATIRRAANDFLAALTTFAHATTTPTILAITPTDPRSLTPEVAKAFASLTDDLVARARNIRGIHVIPPSEITARYPSRDFHQADAQQLGHIAYTPEGFAAIGTAVYRRFAALHRRPLKVIALDCDHTLWVGGCGEDSTMAVAVTPPHRALQEFMLRQRERGILLCLCSKNDAANVWAVFDRHPDMVLRREHITAARINWEPKSVNLRSLAQALHLSSDSILFLDDNPTECAEVRAHCPEVTVVQLPADPDAIPRYLEHVWAFDQGNITADDQARAQRMTEDAHREKFREEAPTLQSFIAGLDLKVDLFAPTPDDFERLAQLTQRTNQFNFSTIRRTESELRHYLGTPNHRALAVRVADRFGDYGLVGLILVEEGRDYIRIDTFLLSCRVLGRGVEHRMFAGIGQLAQAADKASIEFSLFATERNQPARDFVATLEAEPIARPDLSATHRIASSIAAHLRYAPDTARAAESADTSIPTSPATTPLFDETIETVAALDSAPALAQAVEAHRLRAAGFAVNESVGGPETVTGQLLRIWRKALRNPQLGLDDRFMQAGGSSLTAVTIVAAIRREFDQPLTIAEFFESPTVRLLSEKLSPKRAAAVTPNSALARGARRAQRAGRKLA